MQTNLHHLSFVLCIYSMVNIQKKVTILIDGFKHFTSTKFDFKTVNFQKLESELNEKDKKMFFCDMLKVNYIFIKGLLIKLINSSFILDSEE